MDVVNSVASFSPNGVSDTAPSINRCAINAKNAGPQLTMSEETRVTFSSINKGRDMDETKEMIASSSVLVQRELKLTRVEPDCARFKILGIIRATLQGKSSSKWWIDTGLVIEIITCSLDKYGITVGVKLGMSFGFTQMKIHLHCRVNSSISEAI